MMRDDWDVYFLGIARQVAARSTCSRLHVGAVLVQARHIVGTGYNGAPSGLPHCVHIEDEPCRNVVHAEVNALLFARGVNTHDITVMYVTHSPCFECAKLIINAGVQGVIYSTLYRSDEGLRLLSDAGIMCEWVTEN